MDRNTRAQWPGRIAALVVMMMGIPTVLGLAAFFILREAPSGPHEEEPERPPPHRTAPRPIPIFL